MDSALDYAAGVVRRLASTIPAPSSSSSEDHHHHRSSLSSSSSSPRETMMSQIAGDLLSDAPRSVADLLFLTVVVVLALELLSVLVYHVPSSRLGGRARAIPVRGKHLDEFSWKDITFISINKCMTGLFVYCYFGYLWSVRKTGHGQLLNNGHHDHGDEHGHHEHEEEEEQSLGGHHPCFDGGEGIWSTEDLSLANTLLPVPLLFLVYDFFYTLLHWFLHVKSIYAHVHKHHHHQKAPSRANIDAVNVHPLEFFLGEFNHVLALHLVVKGMPLVGFRGMDVSWAGATLFIGMGGALAGLNHTRHDVVVRVPSSSSFSSSGSSDGNKGKRRGGGWTVFDSKHHDVHHRIPQSNYGQYTVAWDRIFGTFRDYNEGDRVNPAYQLDPSTRRTIEKS